MRVERITPTEEAILTALAIYRYLTAAQMLRLGVTSAPAHLYATLRTLAARKPVLLIELDFGAVPVLGRLAKLYVLTPRGAELLIMHGDRGAEIEAPKHVSLFYNDYFHRVACVDFHIALRLWSAAREHTIDFFHTYYDPVPGTPRGGRFAPKTHVRLAKGALVPDAVFSFTDIKGVRRLCTFEMYNGRRTERVIGQLSTYLAALSENAINTAYHYEHAVRVLLAFDSADNLRLVARRMAELPAFGRVSGHFFLAQLSDIRERFFDGWQRFNGEQAALY